MKKTVYELFQLAVSLLEGGDPAQAAVLLERARAEEPDKGSIREALGRAYYNYGQIGPAEEEFRQALKIDPTNHYAHFGMALCLERLGAPRRACGHIKLALAMSPDNDHYERARQRLEVKLKRAGC